MIQIHTNIPMKEIEKNHLNISKLKRKQNKTTSQKLGRLNYPLKLDPLCQGQVRGGTSISHQQRIRMWPSSLGLCQLCQLCRQCTMPATNAFRKVHFLAFLALLTEDRKSWVCPPIKACSCPKVGCHCSRINNGVLPRKWETQLILFILLVHTSLMWILQLQKKTNSKCWPTCRRISHMQALWHFYAFPRSLTTCSK